MVVKFLIFQPIFVFGVSVSHSRSSPGPFTTALPTSWNSGSHTLGYIRIIQRTCLNIDGWISTWSFWFNPTGTCISNQFVGDDTIAIPGTTLETVLKADWMPSPAVRKHRTFLKAAPKSFNQMQMSMIKSHHLKHYLIIIGQFFFAFFFHI